MTDIDNREVEEGQAQTPSPEVDNVPAAGSRRTIIRLVALGLILVVACVAVVAVALQLMRSSRSGPIEVELFPGAQIVQEDGSTASDDRTFQTASSVREVYDFYVARLGTDESRGCRLLRDEQSELEAAKCVVDNSQDEVVHDMLIAIDPMEGGTSIRIQRHWGGG
jgi:hypothetical protein